MSDADRTLGLFGATGVGVGAIVGGGILALAGVAFASAGPAAILAFTLNGVIAVITALSFAEMSRRFPESGGTYSFARRVLSLEAAFAVGWTAWFASIVASVLYALGFAAFAMTAARELCVATGVDLPLWLDHPRTLLGTAFGTILLYALWLMRSAGGGGAFVNVIKVLVFAVLIAGGLWALARSPAGTIARTMTPLMPLGLTGLVHAMGFTFIALQGFDLIAAVAGEVRDPTRNVPRAMLLSLGIALAIYLPLLLVVATVGVEPGTSITEASAARPETIIADAARRFLGVPGYWMVLVAGVLAMLSALQANLLAASRMASSMARDRTLPRRLASRGRRGAPAVAVAVTAGITMAILMVVPDVAAAGAAASLIFLVTFAIVHVIAVLARRRSAPAPGRKPLPAFLPVVGAVTCAALAVFQGVVVPAAGAVSVVWLSIGGVLFILLFAPRARARDAAAEASDPELLRLRGRSPLVLVPVVNPTHATAMVGVANALVAPGVGRALLLSIVTPDETSSEPDITRPLLGVQNVLGEALRASFEAGLAPESLTTIARQPWREIVRVARTHRCEAVLVGLGTVAAENGRLDGGPLERLVGRLPCDAVVLRAPENWSLSDAHRVLVPIGGRGIHDVLRARLVGSLCRTAPREIHYVRVVPGSAPPDRRERVRRALVRLAEDEAGTNATVAVIGSDDPVDAVIAEAAAEADLIILGVRRSAGQSTVFGQFALGMARDTACPLVLIRRRPI